MLNSAVVETVPNSAVIETAGPVVENGAGEVVVVGAAPSAGRGYGAQGCEWRCVIC